MAGKPGRTPNAERPTPNAEVKAGEHSLVLFTSKDGAVSVPATVERESVWLSQAQMADLFGKERSVITKHIRNAVNEGEIDEKSNVQFLHIPHSDKPVAFYNLDVIISIGLKNSSPAQSFPYTRSMPVSLYSTSRTSFCRLTGNPSRCFKSSGDLDRAHLVLN